jgi:hypothetical protein
MLHLDDYTGLIPFGGTRASLILYTDMISDDKGWETSCVLWPSFPIEHVTLAQCCFPVGQYVTPRVVWPVFPWYSVEWGWSLMGRSKMFSAGDTFVSLSGVFRYCSLVVSRSPLWFVLSRIIRFTVSARQLAWGNATEWDGEPLSSWETTGWW